MRLTILTLCITLFISSLTYGQLKVPYKENQVPISAIKNIDGYIGERIEANTEMSIKAFNIDKYATMVEQKNHQDWWWIGEQPGKWLESAVLAAAQSGDKALLNQAESILTRFENAQEPNGYLGITDQSILSPQKPLRGMDPYELYFMLHALISASKQWNDSEALETAKRLANYFVENINEGKAEFWPSNLKHPENYQKIAAGTSNIAGHSVHYSLEGTLLIDPVLRLYEITEDTRYLDWAQWVVNNIDKWSGWDTFSRLDEVASGEIGIHEVQPYVHSHTFQMNFLGLLRLYQITGDESLFRKVKGVWDDVNNRQMYVTGGVSVGEHYEKAFIKPLTGNVVETCATMSWMQLTQQLLLITGNTKYADNIERLLFNHVFASQAFDGDCYRYHIPPNGVKPYEYFHGPDCCTSSGTRIVAMLPLFFYASADKTVFINQYIASDAAISLPNNKIVNLSVKTDYPQSEKIRISFDLEKPLEFNLKLRIPEWCTQPEIKVNGKKIEDIPSKNYASIVRKWKSSDVIEIRFPMELKWIEHQHYSNITISRLPGGEIIFDEDKENKGIAPFALSRGPLIYAVDDIWWQGDIKPANVGNEVAYVRKDPAQFKEVPLPNQLLGPAFSVPVKTVTGETLETHAVPFTNVGLWYKPGETKPEIHSKSYSYAIWLQDFESPDFKELKDKYELLIKENADAVDYILLGYKDSEQAHSLGGKNVNRGSYRDKNYIDAKNSINFTIKVSTTKLTQLVITYWGSDVGRQFDLFANGQKIGEQLLQNQSPNSFFNQTYDIPFDLVKNKTDDFGQKVETVQIEIVAKPGSIAGGVFGIKTIEKRD